jgi:hypothetical protein
MIIEYADEWTELLNPAFERLLQEFDPETHRSLYAQFNLKDGGLQVGRVPVPPEIDNGRNPFLRTLVFNRFVTSTLGNFDPKTTSIVDFRWE